MEGGSIKNILNSFSRGTHTARNIFPKTAIITTAPVIGIALAAKSEKPAVGVATTKT